MSPDGPIREKHFLDAGAVVGNGIIDRDPVGGSGESQDQIVSVVGLRNNHIGWIDTRSERQSVEPAIAAGPHIDRVADNILSIASLEYEGIVASLA